MSTLWPVWLTALKITAVELLLVEPNWKMPDSTSCKECKQFKQEKPGGKYTHRIY